MIRSPTRTVLSLAIAVAAGLSLAPDKPKSLALRYVPPKTNAGAPAVSARLGGATRGPTSTRPQLVVLVPDHLAQASTAQPVLHWFLAAPSEDPVELTVSQEDADEPLLELEIAGPLAAGVHAVPLAAHEVRLDPDRVYEWFVSLRGGHESRAADVLAGAMLRFVPPTPEAAAALAEESHSPAAFAEAGYWYDALAGASPEARRSLLEQVGLQEVAAFRE